MSKKSETRLEDAPSSRSKAPAKGAWRVMDRGSALAAGLLAHRISSLAWRAATGKTAR